MEIESDGTARLRFGDDTNGLRPDSDTKFTASYRIGNGTGGNVGADTLIHCRRPHSDDSAPIRCRHSAARIPKPPTRFAAAPRRRS